MFTGISLPTALNTGCKTAIARFSRQRDYLQILRRFCLQSGSYENSTYLSKDKRRVVFEVDMTGADGADRGWATAEGALARLLGCGVDSLPASVARGQIRSRHPAIIPYVEIPTAENVSQLERVHLAPSLWNRSIVIYKVAFPLFAPLVRLTVLIQGFWKQKVWSQINQRWCFDRLSYFLASC